MSDPVRLPSGLLSSGDPVKKNPFPVNDPRHGIWSVATREAQEALHRFNARMLKHSRQPVVLGPGGHNAWVEDMVAGKYDIWGNRGLSVVRTSDAVSAYDRWLFAYAQIWLETIRDDARRQAESRIDSRVEDLLVQLKARLMERLEHWRAEARKWVAEWEVHADSTWEAANAPLAGEVVARDIDGSNRHPTAYKTALGRNIDRLRKECGWSFDELSVASTVDKKSILRHVNAGGGAYPRTVKAYADAFTERLGRTVTPAELET